MFIDDIVDVVDSIFIDCSVVLRILATFIYWYIDLGIEILCDGGSRIFLEFFYVYVSNFLLNFCAYCIYSFINVYPLILLFVSEFFFASI